MAIIQELLTLVCLFKAFANNVSANDRNIPTSINKDSFDEIKDVANKLLINQLPVYNGLIGNFGQNSKSLIYRSANSPQINTEQSSNLSEASSEANISKKAKDEDLTTTTIKTTTTDTMSSTASITDKFSMNRFQQYLSSIINASFGPYSLNLGPYSLDPLAKKVCSLPFMKQLFRGPLKFANPYHET